MIHSILGILSFFSFISFIIIINNIVIFCLWWPKMVPLNSRMAIRPLRTITLFIFIIIVGQRKNKITFFSWLFTDSKKMEIKSFIHILCFARIFGILFSSFTHILPSSRPLYIYNIRSILSFWIQIVINKLCGWDSSSWWIHWHMDWYRSIYSFEGQKREIAKERSV